MNSSCDESEIRAALHRVAVGAGYEVSELDLLRIGNNYVYADHVDQRIYRVSIRGRDPEFIVDENERLTRIAAAGGPLLAPVQIEPLLLSTGHLATVWPLGSEPEPNPARSLAPTLAELHRTSTVPGLFVWGGFERGRHRLDLVRSSGLPDELVTDVSERLAELERNFPDWSTEVLVHGDAHTGNLVRLGDRNLLIDLDDLALGCPEIDLAPVRSSYQRFVGVPGDWDSFLSAYGRPVDLELLGWFVRLRQLTMLTWLFTLWDFRPESRAEAIHRVSTLDKAAKWNPL